MLPLSRILSFLTLSYYIFSALAAFQHIDSSCNQYGGSTTINAGASEALQALNAAISDIDNAPLQGRISRMLIALIGQPSSTVQQISIGNKLKGKPLIFKISLNQDLTVLAHYQQYARSLGPSPNNLYVYCGDSVVWSSRKPDPSRSECVQQFDPRVRNGQDCGVDVDDVENNGHQGYWYAPNPNPPPSGTSSTGNTANPLGPTGAGKYIQFVNVKNFAGIASGDSLCSDPEAMAATFSAAGPTAGPVVMLFCPQAFSPKPSNNWVTSNANKKYFDNPGVAGATLQAHQGSLSFVIIHEMGHAYALGIPGQASSKSIANF